MSFPMIYVFFMQRPIDSQPFPAVYLNKEVAQRAFGRVSTVVAVQPMADPEAYFGLQTLKI